MSCIVGKKADTDATFRDLLEDKRKPATVIAKIYGNVSATAIKDHRRGDCKCEPDHKVEGLDFSRARVDVEVGGAEGEFKDVVTTARLTPESTRVRSPRFLNLRDLTRPSTGLWATR